MNNNILQLISSPEFGGAERIVEKILQEFDHSCFCLRHTKTNIFENYSNRLYFGTDGKFYKLNFFIFIRLLKVVNHLHINIIHVHLAVPLFYAVIVKLLRPKIKIIYHEHGEIYYNNKLKYFLRIFFKKINKVIAVSETTKQVLIQKSKIKENNIDVVNNFVDLSVFNEKNDSTDIRDFFAIGFAGRIAKIKGIDVLIKALPLLDFNYKVFIAGDGEMLSVYKDMVKDLGLEKKVLFLGYVNNMANIFHNFDILVCSSFSEASPLSVLEAQASGVPVIASDIPSLHEIINDGLTGLLFEVGNELDLASKIKTIYHNKSLCNSIRNNAFKNVQNKYSLDNFLSSLRKIYSNI